MASIPLQALDAHGRGSSSAVSSPNPPPASPPPTTVAAVPSAAGPVASLVPPQRNSIERRRQQAPSPLPQAVRPQATQQATPPTTWSTIIKERSFGIAVFALIIAIVTMAPTFGGYATSVWSSAKDYQDWCKTEKSLNHTLTWKCSIVVNQPLPPPPGLDSIFKDVDLPEPKPFPDFTPEHQPPPIGPIPRAPHPPPPTPTPEWPSREAFNRLTEAEKEEYSLMLLSPIGNGLSLAFFGFFIMMLPLETDSNKWSWFGIVFGLFNLTRKASLIFVLRNVSLLMDWCYWFRKLKVESPSLGVLALLPVFYGLGWINVQEGLGSQITVGVVSALVVGDHYSLKAIQVYSILSHTGIEKYLGHK